MSQEWLKSKLAHSKGRFGSGRWILPKAPFIDQSKKVIDTILPNSHLYSHSPFGNELCEYCCKFVKIGISRECFTHAECLSEKYKKITPEIPDFLKGPRWTMACRFVRLKKTSIWQDWDTHTVPERWPRTQEAHRNDRRAWHAVQWSTHSQSVGK